MKKLLTGLFLITIVIFGEPVVAEERAMADFIIFTIDISEAESIELSKSPSSSIDNFFGVKGNKTLNANSSYTEISDYLISAGAVMLPSCRQVAMLGKEVGSYAAYNVQYMEKTTDQCYQLKTIPLMEASGLRMKAVVTKTDSEDIYHLKGNIMLRLIEYRDKLEGVDLDIGLPHFTEQKLIVDTDVPEKQWTELCMVKLTEPHVDSIRLLIIWTLIQQG